MRRLSALAVAVAAAGSMFAGSPANAVGVSTCIVVVGVSVSPSGGVTIDRLEVRSVHDCLYA